MYKGETFTYQGIASFLFGVQNLFYVGTLFSFVLYVQASHASLYVPAWHSFVFDPAGHASVYVPAGISIDLFGKGNWKLYKKLYYRMLIQLITFFIASRTQRKNEEPTVGENIIATTKIRNNYSAIQSLIFLYCSL